MTDLAQENAKDAKSGAHTSAYIVRTPAPGLPDRLEQALRGKIRSAVLSRAGVSKRTLARALAGEPIRRDNLLALADAMQVSREWLVNSYGPMEYLPVGHTTAEGFEVVQGPTMPLSTPPDPPRPQTLLGSVDMRQMATAIEIAEETWKSRNQNPSNFRKAQVFMALYDALSLASPNKVREIIHLWDEEDLQKD